MSTYDRLREAEAVRAHRIATTYGMGPSQWLTHVDGQGQRVLGQPFKPPVPQCAVCGAQRPLEFGFGGHGMSGMGCERTCWTCGLWAVGMGLVEWDEDWRYKQVKNRITAFLMTVDGPTLARPTPDHLLTEACIAPSYLGKLRAWVDSMWRELRGRRGYA